MSTAPTAPAELAPIFPDAQVFLEAGPQDLLALITVTVAALERVGEQEAADVFATVALTCADEDELLVLINCTVTVI